MILAFSLGDIIKVPFGYLLDWMYQFTNNYGFTSGGAVMTNNRTNIYDSYFFNNSSVSYGGALVSYSTTLVSGGTFSGNESTSGAVIFVGSMTLFLSPHLPTLPTADTLPLSSVTTAIT